jgi:type I restriction enzyme S subunit
MGKLVPQNPDDEPAAVLLEKIKAEKERLVKEGKIKKSKELPSVDVGEMAFELPQGWEWCYVSDISFKVTDGEHITPKRTTTGYYLLSARNVRDEGIVLDKVDYVPLEEFERIKKRCNPEKNDILISCSGSVGRVAIVDKDNAYVMVRSVALLKPFHNYLYSYYLAHLLKSTLVQKQIIEKSKASAQSNLFLGKIKEIKIVLPPLNEQHRIVTKVNQMMCLCDELEAKLTQSIGDRDKLMSAAVRQVLAV